MQALGHALGGCGSARAAGGQVELLSARAVRAQLEAEEAAFCHSLEHDRAHTVAEEHCRAAVAPVENPREDVAPHNERALAKPAREHPVRLSDRVHEPGATRGEVVGGRILGAELVGKDRAGRRKRHVGRDGCDDDQVEVGGRNACVLERLFGCRQRQVGEGLLRRSDPALADAGALHDPLVGGVHHRRELVVGHDALGNVRAEARDRDADAVRRADHSRSTAKVRVPRAAS